MQNKLYTMRHRVKRLTMGKTPVKHASTLVDNTGPGVGSFFGHVIYETDVGARATSGATKNIQEKSTTGRIIQVGDIVKYVNVCLQCSPRGADSTNIKDDSGWLEWAFVFQRERDQSPTVANIGTSTLGEVCSNVYREDCLMTGCFPVGSRQSMSLDLKFKLPEKACKIRMGYLLKIFCYVRGSSSTDTRTDSNRLIASSFFKSYS